MDWIAANWEPITTAIAGAWGFWQTRQKRRARDAAEKAASAMKDMSRELNSPERQRELEAWFEKEIAPSMPWMKGKR